MILLIFASQVARMTDVSHWCPDEIAELNSVLQ
jgi:hypothetical protein